MQPTAAGLKRFVDNIVIRKDRRYVVDAEKVEYLAIDGTEVLREILIVENLDLALRKGLRISLQVLEIEANVLEPSNPDFLREFKFVSESLMFESVLEILEAYPVPRRGMPISVHRKRPMDRVAQDCDDFGVGIEFENLGRNVMTANVIGGSLTRSRPHTRNPQKFLDTKAASPFPWQANHMGCRLDR